MKTPSCIAVALLLGTLALVGCQHASSTSGASSPGQVVVEFPTMDKFTDFDDGPVGRPDAAKDHAVVFSAAIRNEAQRYLSAGQTFTVKFTDIDLAGSHLPSLQLGANSVRVVTDHYPPRIELTFTLTDATGAVIKQGNRTLTDRGFEVGSSSLAGGQLQHDVAILRDWVRAELRPAKVAAPARF